MDIPSDLRYSREHEWVRAEEDLATVGITAFAQDELGDIVYILLPEAGSRVESMARIGEIESIKSVSDLYCPVSGDVVERNDAVLNRPELINQDPYGQGWLVKIRMSDRDQLKTLLSAAEYTALNGASS